MTDYFQVPDEYPSGDTIGAYAPILLSAVDELILSGTTFEGAEPLRKLQTLKNWIASELGNEKMSYEMLFDWSGYALDMAVGVYRAVTPNLVIGFREGQKLVIETLIEVTHSTGSLLEFAMVAENDVRTLAGMAAHAGDLIRTRSVAVKRANTVYMTNEVWVGNGLSKIDQNDVYALRPAQITQSADTLRFYLRCEPMNADAKTYRARATVERFG